MPCATAPGTPYRCPSWAAAYAGPAGEDVAYAAALSPGGATVYVTGWSQEPYEPSPGYSFDYATVAHDAASGVERWATRYNGTGKFFDVAVATAVSPDGTRVFVTGYSYGVTYDYVTLAYDAATGEQVWRATYKGTGAGTDLPNDLEVSPDGATVYVTGGSDSGETGVDAVTVAYDAASGAQRWVWRMAGERNYEDAGLAVAPDPDGRRVYVAAKLGPQSNWGFLVGAFGTPDGENVPRELWRSTYQGSSNNTDLPADLTVTPAGLVVVTGEGFSSATAGDFLTIAFDTDSGQEAWQARYDGTAWPDEAHAIRQSPDGKTLYVAGSSLKQGITALTGDWDAVVAAYDAATGAQRWATRIDGETRGDDFGLTLGVRPDGSQVFVSGSAHNVPSGAFGIFYDYATTALATADGATLWRARYDSADQDIPTALLAGPGRVHVTGTSFNPMSGYDFATVTYDA